jgi:peroxiredoxin
VPSRAQSQPHRSLGTRIFLLFLASVAGLYGTILALHAAFPRQPSVKADSWLEECRELCLSYGLIPTGHVANDAEAYLAVAKPQDLVTPLADLLADAEFTPVDSEPHPLLGQSAPEFPLPNDRRETVSLQELIDQGPVVVVFYYGYGGSLCVAQLFGLQKDLAYFRELGAQVVAISSDSSEHTAERFAEYGRFDFPVLSDPDNAIAQQWGVFTPRSADADEDRLHGTFLIDRSGQVIFANRGYQPFLDNKSLLFWLAGQRPTTLSSTEPATAKVGGAEP